MLILEPFLFFLQPFRAPFRVVGVSVRGKIPLVVCPHARQLMFTLLVKSLDDLQFVERFREFPRPFALVAVRSIPFVLIRQFLVAVPVVVCALLPFHM